MATEAKWGAALPCIIASIGLLAAAQPCLAGETSLRLMVYGLDGAPHEHLLTPEEGEFHVYRQSDGSLYVSFAGPSYGEYYSFTFRAAHGLAPVPGSYYDAQSYPDDDQNGLTYSYYCQGPNGSFEVKQFADAPNSLGTPEQLWLLFQPICGGVVEGEIRWNADVQAAVRAPLEAAVDIGQTLTLPVAATSVNAGPITLSASGLPVDAGFLDRGDGTGTVTWTNRFEPRGKLDIVLHALDAVGATDQTTTRVETRGVRSLSFDYQPPRPYWQPEFHTSDDGRFGSILESPHRIKLSFWERKGANTSTLDFAAPPGEDLAPGVYENAVPPDQQQNGQPGLLIDPKGINSCASRPGRFEVKQIHFDPSGKLMAFQATFETDCPYFNETLMGEVRYDADLPLLVRGPTSLSTMDIDEVTFDVNGLDRAGGAVSLSAADLPQGATFADLGNATGRFAWTPGQGHSGVFVPRFVATNGAGDSDAITTQIEVRLASDDFDHAIRIPALPFRLTSDMSSASAATDDPVCGASYGATVWYVFSPDVDTPVLGHIVTDTGYSGYPLSVYAGSRGALTEIECGQGEVRFNAIAGKTYHFMVGSPARLTFTAEVTPPPPPNDERRHATVVSQLPFQETLDTRSATAAPDDPQGCYAGGNQKGTVWYSFTPTDDVNLHVDLTGSDRTFYVTSVAGGVSCYPGLPSIGPASFAARAGRTYDIVISSLDLQGGNLVVSITGTPLLDVRLAIDPIGSFDPRTGTGLIHGTVTCPRSAHVQLYGSLGRVRGTFTTSFDCDGTLPWSAEILSQAGAKGRGSKTADSRAPVSYVILASTDDPLDQVTLRGSGSVRLRTGPGSR